MTSDEEFILYDGGPLTSCGRSDIGRTHSDEAESSQKHYSGTDGREEYTEDQDFRLAVSDDRLQGKGLEGLHGVNKGLEGLDGRLMGMQSQNLLMGINGARMHRRPPDRIIGGNVKRRDREETSDGGTYFKKTKVADTGGCKKDREEWSDGAISCLLDAYTEKFLQLNRGNLRGSDWEEVAAMVSERADGQRPAKTMDQCKNKLDSLKKRYKTEKNRGMMANNGMTQSHWPWFKKVDQIAGSASKLTVNSDDEKERVSGTALVATATSKLPSITPPLPQHNVNVNTNPVPMQYASPNRRLQVPLQVSVGLLNTPKKTLSSSLRWKRVLLKVSGRSLVGAACNVDPGILDLIAREIAIVIQHGIEVAIVVGGGNFINGSTWVSSGGIDRVAADHAGMMGTVMNSILLQASLEKIGVPSRIQTAFKFVEIVEPYIRQKAIRHLEKGRVVIFGAGMGNPFFTTDAAAAVRADEINADVIVKATNIDGIYDSDPKVNPEAVFHDHLSYRDAVAKGSSIMDITAITHCQERGIPVVVFHLNEPGNISKAIIGERIGTFIDQNGPVPLY